MSTPGHLPAILVAGIGNIFQGDDAFGVEVAQQLLRRELPRNVRVVDFGIRSYDLAYALLDAPAVTILVDATARGGAPGTLYLIEPDLAGLETLESQAVDSHTMNPVAVLQLVQTLGGNPPRLLLVGCEPADLGGEAGAMGLSAAVQTAVGAAIAMIESLIAEVAAAAQTATSAQEHEHA